METQRRSESVPRPATPCDVLVAGGGPAGSTLATLLARRGHRVVLLDRDRHPRFHIGESLLPMTAPLLDTLGVRDRVEEIGIRKYGAEFNHPEHTGERITFYFAEAMDKHHPHAWEVRRSEFDELLFRNAEAEPGVTAHENMRLREVTFQADGSVLASATGRSGAEHRWHARWLVDATGRDGFLPRRLGIRRRSRKHASAAIFGHFEQVERRPGRDEGNISIYWFEHGWFWMIPLRDGIMSVGAVCHPQYLRQRDCPVEEFLWRTIALQPEVQARMREARLVGEARATGNFSYEATRMYGPRGENWLLVGDSYAFIDPVFSSGVHLAMSAAFSAAETLDACLAEPARRDALLAEHRRRMLRGLRTFSWLIHRFNSLPMRRLFMAPRNDFRMKEAIISLLAGDVFRDTPIHGPLRLFKLVYYATFAANLPRALPVWLRMRRQAFVRFTGGTTPQDQPESG